MNLKHQYLFSAFVHVTALVTLGNMKTLCL